MKRNWMNKLLLAVFLITMVTPVPVQAKAYSDPAGEMPVLEAVRRRIGPGGCGNACSGHGSG